MKVETAKEGGSRVYFDADNPSVRYPGVTSVIDMLDKPFLNSWNAWMAADLAVKSVEHVQSLIEDRGEQYAVNHLKGAASRYNRLRRDIGTKAHNDVFEPMLHGEYPRRLPADIVPYRDRFAEFLADANPEMVRTEYTAWSDLFRYAGRFDADIRVWFDTFGRVTPDRSGTPRVVRVDWKTSKQVHAEVALQLAGYRYAEWLITPEGERLPMPTVDDTYVLHVTPTSYDFIHAETEDPVVFAAFLHLRGAYDWDREISKTVLREPVLSRKVR